MTEQPAFICTLDEAGARDRLTQTAELTARLQRRERHRGRLLLSFDDAPGTRAMVDEFVRDESRCCSFFGFHVEEVDGAVVLEISAPEGAEPMLAAAQESFDPRPDEGRMARFREVGG